mgnify:CR=1 FL=1
MGARYYGAVSTLRENRMSAQGNPKDGEIVTTRVTAAERKAAFMKHPYFYAIHPG